MLLDNRYIMGKELGRGGIGVVYLARDRKLHDKPVVIKILLDAIADAENWDWFLKHFRQEIEALARINHHGVVGVLDTGELPDGRPYFVMQFVEGVTLRAALKARSGLSLERAASLLRQIGHALQAAHEQRVFHRDLKPEKIMLQTLSSGAEQVKLIDFGIATVKHEQASFATSSTTTEAVGTVPYMAPEQMDGKPSAASDIYALGVIAYEMLTGRLPFNPPSPYQLLDAIRAGVSVKPASLRPDLPLAAQELILQALSFDEKARPNSAHAFGEKLAQALTSALNKAERDEGRGTGNLAATAQLAAGTVIAGRYRIARRIGGSGLGAVYLAEDQQHAGYRVVIREMIELAPDEATLLQARAAFHHEAARLAQLRHPAIPAVYHYFYDPGKGCYYLINRFVEGRTLAAYQQVAGGKVDELTVTEWAVQICDALSYLHAQTPPLIYGDATPANLLVEARHQRITLLDFGLARLVAPVIKGHIPQGTMGYAPPELYRGQREPRSDIYALGATLFHLLTGCNPAEAPLLVFDFSKNPKPRQLAPELSAQMEELLCRAVEFKAENRFPTAQAFGAELRAHLQRLQAHAAVTLTTEPLPGPFCVKCGRKLALDDVFCAQCGQQVRLRAELLVLGDGGQPAAFLLNAERETLIGRVDPQQGVYPQVDLTLHDPTTSVSRRHARLFARAGQFFIEDLHSANGTAINGAPRLTPQQPQPLTNGDEIKCGDARLRFVLNAAPR